MKNKAYNQRNEQESKQTNEQTFKQTREPRMRRSQWRASLWATGGFPRLLPLLPETNDLLYHVSHRPWVPDTCTPWWTPAQSRDSYLYTLTGIVYTAFVVTLHACLHRHTAVWCVFYYNITTRECQGTRSTSSTTIAVSEPFLLYRHLQDNNWPLL